MKTDEVAGMKESDNEGLANHIGPESCAGSGNTAGEALTGVRAGWVLSLERDTYNLGADAVLVSGRQHCTHRYGKECTVPAGSETPCMHGTTTYRNREAL